jgi:hypothetical protein
LPAAMLYQDRHLAYKSLKKPLTFLPPCHPETIAPLLFSSSRTSRWRLFHFFLLQYLFPIPRCFDMVFDFVILKVKVADDSWIDLASRIGTGKQTIFHRMDFVPFQIMIVPIRLGNFLHR